MRAWCDMVRGRGIATRTVPAWCAHGACLVRAQCLSGASLVRMWLAPGARMAYA